MKKWLTQSRLASSPALRRIAVVAGACATVGLVYGFVAPKWYKSVLTVVPAKAQKGAGGLSSLLGSVDLSSMGLDSPMGGADTARIAAVLQSISVTDAVIEKFDLRNRYDQKYQETTRDALWRHCDVATIPRANLVQLTCEDKDPEFVRQMLSFFASYGNEVFRRVGVSGASEEVRFLERRVTELRHNADAAADRMRTFQETHRIVDLDTQARAVVSSIATLNAQRLTKQMELDFAQTYSSGDEATLQQLRSQVGVIRSRQRDLEEPHGQELVQATPGVGKAGDEGGARSLFPAALSVPKLRAEYEVLFRDRKVAEATLVFALERLEAAKATEARDVSTFLVLDEPAAPTRHSRPKRLMAGLIGLVLGLGVAGMHELWKSGLLRSLMSSGPVGS